MSVGSLFKYLDVENSLGGEREGRVEEFHAEGTVGGLMSGLLGLFLWGFFKGLVAVSVLVLEIVLGAAVARLLVLVQFLFPWRH